jgi:hypothetical protein
MYLPRRDLIATGLVVVVGLLYLLWGHRLGAVGFARQTMRHRPRPPRTTLA